MSAEYVAVDVTAGRDRNGNTRRAVLIYSGGDVVAVLEGYYGEHTVMRGGAERLEGYECFGKVSRLNDGSPLKITPAHYRQLLAPRLAREG